MDDAVRVRIAEALEVLAAHPVWCDEAWNRCYELVKANLDEELVAYVHDDLIHCSATPLISFRKPAKHPMFDEYRQEFRDVATALRSRLTLSEAKMRFDI